VSAGEVSLHNILLGVCGTINILHSLELLAALGLNSQEITKLALKFHAHLVQCAYKPVSTRTHEKTFATSRHQGQEWGTAGHLPEPH